MKKLLHFMREKPWQFIGLTVMLILMIASMYATFEQDSKVTRTYFIDEFKRAKAAEHEAQIDKPAIVTPANKQTIAVPTKEIENIKVQVGQQITTADELATYKGSEIDDASTRLNAEKSAYQSELSTLQSALSTAQRENRPTSRNPQGSIKTQQRDKDLNVNVQVDLPQQQDSNKTAIAIIEGNIAQTKRQIEIVDAQIRELQAKQGVISPIDGVIADIKEDAGNIVFDIYSDERALRTYVNEKTWQQVTEDDVVNFTLKHTPKEDEPIMVVVDEDADEDDTLTAVLTQKVLLPIDQTTYWASHFQTTHPLKENQAYYELIMTPDTPISDMPYAAESQVSIITDQSTEANKVPTKWVKKVTEVEEIEGETFKTKSENVYTVGYDGKIRLEPITIDFEYKKNTIFQSIIEDGTPILNQTERDVMARTFRTMPITTDKAYWKQFKKLKWKDYVKYSIMR